MKHVQNIKVKLQFPESTKTPFFQDRVHSVRDIEVVWVAWPQPHVQRLLESGTKFIEDLESFYGRAVTVSCSDLAGNKIHIG